MNAKALGVIVSFTALTIALNFVKIPAPYNPTVLSYQMGDVALVIALLLFGLKIAVTTAALSTVITIILATNAAGPIGPPYYLIAVLAMFLGIYIGDYLVKNKNIQERWGLAKSAVFSTAFGALTRTLIMLPLDYILYGFLVSIVSGLSVSESYIIIYALMPTFIIYNITVPILMIPPSYVIADRISNYCPSTFQKSTLLKSAKPKALAYNPFSTKCHFHRLSGRR